MFRSLNKKKGDDLTSPPPQKEKRWKKGKKGQAEEKPQLDLNSALPSVDDFRTSLIMPNLSTRFSMLREQDDPNSLLGKASDDSVLAPKRQSRLFEFGFSGPNNGLSDIAEVASINSSLRPPLAVMQRTGSYASEEGYGNDDDSSHNGSVMARARPAEGNVLFGGRQKIYKIADGSQGSTGRLLYDNDVNLSAFQKYRQREKEAAAAATTTTTTQEEQDADVGATRQDDQTQDAAVENAHGFNFSDDVEHVQGHRAAMRSPSPSSSDHKRSTSLSSTSPPSQRRSSTAATSVGSVVAASAPTSAPAPAATTVSTAAPVKAMAGPGLERSLTKRRLYEQGMEQHMYEQQTSALTRLNSIQRRPTLSNRTGPPMLSHAKSVGNLHDRSYQPYAVQSRSAPPLAPLTTFGSLRKPNSKGSSPVPSYPQSPTSPLNDIDQMGVLSSALNPEDRGKATAMGAFNKPAQQFDEQQYLERQRQLQHSMDNAAQRRPSVGKFAPRKNSIDNFAPRRPSVDHFAPRRPSVNSPAQRQNSVDDLVQRKNSVDISDQSVQARLVRCEQGPDRANSRASQRARSQSASRQSQRPLQSQSPQTQPQPQQELEQEPEPELQVQAQPESSASAAFSVFQNAALQMRAAQGNLQHPSSHATHEIPDTHKTFFGDISASDSEDEDVQEISRQPGHGFYSNAYSNGPVGGRFPGTMLPSVFEHPALRSHGSAFNIIEEEEDIPEVPPLRPTPSARSLQTDTATIPAPTPEEQEIDSPTMGMNDAALSGLVHQHLRNDSNQSSIYPDRKSVHPMPPPQPSVPSLSDATSRNTRYTVDSDRRINSSYTNSNPWDLEEFDGGYYYGEQDTRSPVSPVDSNKSRNNLASASSKPNVHADRASTALRDSEPLEGAWQAELKRQHTRDASTATQQEREAFDNELAARQQAIQEKLKNMVESQSRGVSPVPSVSGALKAFGMLKRRDSRESMANPQDGASAKAMKMLGIGSSNPVGSSTTSLQNQHDRYHGYEESRPDTAMTNRTNGYLPNASAQRTPPTRRDRSQSRPRGDSETSTTGNMRVRGPMPPQPNANQSRSRSRSNSAVSAGRSRSRTGRYRDDLDKAMKEGMASSASGLPELSQQLTPRPSPEMYQYSSPPLEGQGRARSNSKHATPGYFEAKNLQPIQTMGNPRLTPGGLTPATLSHATFHSASSGIGSPYPNANTPPLSAATTPVMQASEIMPKVPNMPPIEKNKPLLRKKTVNKFDISEPTLISSTSNVDTVDLPPGASLKNGMDEYPPHGPRRRKTNRLFSFGRDGASDEPDRVRANMISPPPPPLVPGHARENTLSTTEDEVLNSHHSQRARSASRGARGGPGNYPRSMRSHDNFEQPAYGYNARSSPERPMVEGGMF